MANFSDLPPEICLIIAESLTESQLFQHRLINSVFLNSWFDRRWKEVEIYVDARISKSVVRHLTRIADPFVAVRTKRLTIRFNAGSTSPSSFDMCLNTTLTVLPLLLSLTSLRISLTRLSASHAATIFRTITSSSVAKRLRILLLSGDVQMFASLGECSADTPFSNLTELVLTFGLNDHFKSSTRTEPSLALEPFLRSLAPNLQLLNIWLYSLELDLSPLFDALSPLPTSRSGTPVFFPNLKSLSFFINLTTQSFRRFLISHNNLEHLKLSHMSSQNNDELWDAWFADLVNSNTRFPSLRSLNIYPSTTQAGLSSVLALIKLTASTLSSLTIPSRYLTFQEAKQVVNALTAGEVQVQRTTPPTEEEPKIKSLSMNLFDLSISLLDLIAGKLPQLEELSLSVYSIVDDSAQYSFYDLLHHRRYDANITRTQDVLHTWKLHQLSIKQSGGEEMPAVRAVAGAVPTLSRAMGLEARG